MVDVSRVELVVVKNRTFRRVVDVRLPSGRKAETKLKRRVQLVDANAAIGQSAIRSDRRLQEVDEFTNRRDNRVQIDVDLVAWQRSRRVADLVALEVVLTGVFCWVWHAGDTFDGAFSAVLPAEQLCHPSRL